MSKLVNIKIHGILGEQLGQSEWKLKAKNVGEAVRGIQTNSKHKFYKYLQENDTKNIRYRVLINNEDFFMEEGKDPDTIDGLVHSELVMNLKNLKTIDIVPVMEGSDNFMMIFTIILGVILIAAGGAGLGLFGAAGGMGSSGIAGGMAATASNAMINAGFSAAMQMMAGLSLVAAGVSSLMTPIPKFGDFREIEEGGSASYLFNGPENTIREGGPVFVGYGRLLVGSHVIQSAADTINVDAGLADADGNVSAKWGVDKGRGLKYNVPLAADKMRTAVKGWGIDPGGD